MLVARFTLCNCFALPRISARARVKMLTTSTSGTCSCSALQAQRFAYTTAPRPVRRFHELRSVATAASSGNGTVEEAGPRNAFVPGQEAAARQQLFNNIAPVYDELNDRLSFGQHWVWKKMTVKWSGAKPGQKALDVCCGSGDIAMLLAQAVGTTGQVGLQHNVSDPMIDSSHVRFCRCITSTL